MAIASPLDPVLEVARFRLPLLVRQALTRIPEILQLGPKRLARVQAHDEAGNLFHDIEADSSRYHMVTGV